MKKKILFSVFSVLMIIFLMPRGVFLELIVTRGSTWSEPTLIAPFDIPLLKSATQLDKDQKLIESSFEPIFTLDTSYIGEIKDSVYLQTYRKGIISDADLSNIKSSYIRIIDGNSIYHKNILDLTKVSDIEKLLSEQQINEAIIPSLKFDEKLSNQDKYSLQKKISTTNGLISEGSIIVSEGQIIDENTQLRIDSYIKEYQFRMGTDAWWLLIALGRLIIISLTFALNLLFFTIYSKNQDFKTYAFINGAYVVVVALISIVYKFGFSQPYIIPLTIIPILFLVLFNVRTAIVGSITISIIATMFTQFPFEYFTVNILTGISAILFLQNFYHRNELFKAIGLLIIIQVITTESFQLIEGYPIISTSSLKKIIILIISNVILLGMYQLIYVIEKIFKFVSNVTLLENSDTNQPLLLELSRTASGTFQHSVQVANLAENAAKLVGANPLLARCGALYHDIGKMKHPMYFIENSAGDNPHDDCSPQESAEIIKSHVSDGIAIAKEHGLPECIIRFISTHHGNSVISYFYDKACKLHKDATTDISEFMYLGENPQSKEECICMICDTIEAASRSLNSYDKQTIEELVERLVDKIITNGHLIDSQLTFEEVHKIKEMLKEQLQSIYHVRIAYPK